MDLIGRGQAPDGLVFISAAPSSQPDKPESRKYHRVNHMLRWSPIAVTEEEALSRGFTCCGMKSCLGPIALKALEDREARKRAERRVTWEQREAIKVAAAQRGRAEADGHRLTGVEDMRWFCSCGAYGRKRWPNEGAAAFEWHKHILRLAEVMMHQNYDEGWMHSETADLYGLRLADIQRSFGLGEIPVVGKYPWSMVESV